MFYVGMHAFFLTARAPSLDMSYCLRVGFSSRLFETRVELQQFELHPQVLAAQNTVHIVQCVSQENPDSHTDSHSTMRVRILLGHTVQNLYKIFLELE